MSEPDPLSRPSQTAILLQRTFSHYATPHRPCHAVLTTEGLQLSGLTSAGKECLSKYPFESLTGCHAMRCRPNYDSLYGDGQSAFVCLYAYRQRVKRTGKRQRTARRRDVIVLRVNDKEEFEENLEVVEEWRRAILQQMAIASFRGSLANNSQVDIGSGSRPHVLVIINPFSGTRKGPEIWRDRLLPILLEADITWETVVTQHGNQARNMIAADPSVQRRYDAVFVIGGDGLLFEVLNGLLRQGFGTSPIAEIPIGIIPGGSGNALATNVAVLHHPAPVMKQDSSYPEEEDPVLFACLNAVRGLKTTPRPTLQPMDLAIVQTSKPETVISCLGIGWGLIPDVDIGSEKLRLFGDVRFTLWSFHRLINLKTYRGRISYLPVECPKSALEDAAHPFHPPDASRAPAASPRRNPLHCTQSVPLVHSQSVIIAGQRVSTGSENMNNNNRGCSHAKDNERDDLEAAAFSLVPAEVFHSDVEDALEALPCDGPASQYPGDEKEFFNPHLMKMPPLGRALDSSWTVVEDDFVLVYASLVPWIGNTTPLVPFARLNDGVMWLVFLKKGASRAQLFQCLKLVELGEHFDNRILDDSLFGCIPVRAIRIEPLSSGSYITVDGEAVEYGAIQAEILPSGSPLLAANASKSLPYLTLPKMAEFVQIRIEEMIPELEEMGRLGIFDHKEINCLIKKRKEFEYRLHRQTKRKEDILGYIQYERNLKDLIRKRRQRLGKDQKRREIEYAINERICKLFRILTIRWKSDVQVWLSFIEFCRETKQFSQASHAFVDLLACHSEDPKLWISAARFEMDDNKCPEVARKLLFRALKFHPRHQEILVEYFRLELLYVDRLRKRQKALGITVSGAASKVESASRDAVMNGELIDVAYESVVEDLMEHNELEEAARFAVGCLACCGDFEETEKIEQKIVSDLEEKFSCCPLAWDTIARRKLDKETYTGERDPPKLMQRVR
ncbi:unnamed protein product [Cyprideis torosa]|uniref:Uncharacterized protein n=1 Tax=Cyprideis torosa TaxID=163714 RepID=A0A7R8ZW38_9CRUS|nr:unnamed protein product [Cyprideis torosa]CAG0904133.1 unnamed protein product [Cyprideis torosa]